jgi:hypothetical protein
VLDRADKWWRDLRFWSIPRGEQIARDRIGVAGAPVARAPVTDTAK